MGRPLLYSTYLGGDLSGGDIGGTFIISIALDGAGNAYVSGGTDTTDFPVTPKAFQTAIAPSGSCGTACADGFLTKVNATGTGILYSTYFGGTGSEFVFNMALDPAGAVWLTENVSDSQFHTRDPLQEICGCLYGSSDAVLAKLRPAGTGAADLLFNTFLGGTGYDQGQGVAVDAHGSAYLTGFTNSPDLGILPPGVAPIAFPTTPGAFQTVHPDAKGGYSSAFVTKVSDVCSTPITGSVTGDVLVGRGGVGCLINAKVSGSVTVQRGGDLSIDHSTINGPVTAIAATSLTVCGSTLGAGLHASATTGFVRVGSGDAPGCAVNHIDGDVSLINNRGGFELGGDIVTGNASVNGNTGSPNAFDDSVPEVEHNRVSGTLACARNTPAPSDDNLPNRAGVKVGQCASL